MSNDRLTQLLGFHRSNPKDSFILFALAKEYEGLGEIETALEYYLKLESDDPTYIGTYFHLGKLYEGLGQAEKANATYKKGMDISNKAGDRHAYSELAEAKLGLGDDEDFE